jgi:hypothetical protein
MTNEKPAFSLHVMVKEEWSWADIKPNRAFGEENPPSINPFNEMMAKN